MWIECSLWESQLNQKSYSESMQLGPRGHKAGRIWGGSPGLGSWLCRPCELEATPPSPSLLISEDLECPCLFFNKETTTPTQSTPRASSGTQSFDNPWFPHSTPTIFIGLEIRAHFSVLYVYLCFQPTPYCTTQVLKTNSSVRIWPQKSHLYEKEYLFSRGFEWRKERHSWLSVANLESIFQK